MSSSSKMHFKNINANETGNDGKIIKNIIVFKQTASNTVATCLSNCNEINNVLYHLMWLECCVNGFMA